MAEREFSSPIRVKVKNVALYGDKEQIDTIDKGEYLLRNIGQITTIELINSDGKKSLGVLLSRLNQEVPRFLIIIPCLSLFNDYLEARRYSEDVDYPFTFNYEDSIQPVLSTNQIISCSTDEKSLHMKPIIQQLFASPIQTPNLSPLQNDNPDYTSSTFCTPSDIRSSNSQMSSIKLCFHS